MRSIPLQIVNTRDGHCFSSQSDPFRVMDSRLTFISASRVATENEVYATRSCFSTHYGVQHCIHAGRKAAKFRICTERLLEDFKAFVAKVGTLYFPHVVTFFKCFPGLAVQIPCQEPSCCSATYSRTTVSSHPLARSAVPLPKSLS